MRERLRGWRATVSFGIAGIGKSALCWQVFTPGATALVGERRL